MKNVKNFKRIILLFIAIQFLVGCSTVEESEEFNLFKIKGKVIREQTSVGLAEKKVYIKTIKVYGSGFLSYKKIIDSKEVVTNSEGHFEVNMKNSENTFIGVFIESDNVYTQFGNSKDSDEINFNLSNELLIKLQKIVKFRINVRNISPINSQDYINVRFVENGGQAIRTQIINYGDTNIIYPIEYFAGGGSSGPIILSAWNGMNVNSAILYDVSENNLTYQLYWEKRKNGIAEKGVTSNIPFNIEILNVYNFTY